MIHRASGFAFGFVVLSTLASGLRLADKIGAHELLRTDLERVGVVDRFKAFGSDHFRQWGEIVFGGFEAGVGGLALCGDENGRSGRGARGFGRALESCQENLIGWRAFRGYLFRAENPSCGNFEGECIGAVAVEMRTFVVGAGIRLGESCDAENQSV